MTRRVVTFKHAQIRCLGWYGVGEVRRLPSRQVLTGGVPQRPDSGEGPANEAHPPTH
jgi:hypothetical protein